MSSVGGASSDAADKHETAGETGKMNRLNQADATWGEQLLKAAADLVGTDHDGSDSELSDTDHFLTKGAFLLTPSHELSMEKASSICEKMNFKGLFSLTKTATGILFKFSEPEDYQAVFKKGFHKVTNARVYKKVPIPCRPQKTFTVFVLEIPEDIPEEDIRHSLYKFHSVVEVIRLPKDAGMGAPSATGSTTTEKSSAANPGTEVLAASIIRAMMTLMMSVYFYQATRHNVPEYSHQHVAADKTSGLPGIASSPPLVRVTLASLEEYNTLLQNGLDFYGATFFPTEATASTSVARTSGRKSILGNRVFDVVTTSGQRVRDMLPVFDAAGFSKIPPPAIKTIKPRRAN